MYEVNYPWSKANGLSASWTLQPTVSTGVNLVIYFWLSYFNGSYVKEKCILWLGKVMKNFKVYILSGEKTNRSQGSIYIDYYFCFG